MNANEADGLHETGAFSGSEGRYCRRVRDEFAGCHAKPRHRKVSGFLFSDDRCPGRKVAVRDRCVGMGEFISVPGVWKSCGFRTLHEI